MISDRSEFNSNKRGNLFPFRNRKACQPFASLHRRSVILSLSVVNVRALYTSFASLFDLYKKDVHSLIPASDPDSIYCIKRDVGTCIFVKHIPQ